MKFLKNEGHQGDCYIRRVDISEETYNLIRATAKKIEANEHGRVTAVVGEGANKHHSFAASDDCELLELNPIDNTHSVKRMLAKIGVPTSFDHWNIDIKGLSGEHDSIGLDTGYYIFSSQCETDKAGRLMPVTD